jgi:hypothetical protein
VAQRENDEFHATMQIDAFQSDLVQVEAALERLLRTVRTHHTELENVKSGDVEAAGIALAIMHEVEWAVPNLNLRSLILSGMRTDRAIARLKE